MISSALKHLLLLGLTILIGCNEVNVIHVSPSANATTNGFSIESYKGAEGTNFVFVVKLAKPLSTETTVDFSTEDGTATAGSHYTSTNGTLTFAPGEQTKTIAINTVANSSEVCASERNFSVKLTNPTGSPIISDTGKGTIHDPDLPDLSISSVSVTEGGVGSMTATLSGVCPTKNVSFKWKSTNGTAVAPTDFVAVDTSVTIPANTLSIPLLVTTVDDTIYEGTENLSITLSSVSNANLSVASATMTILDNESVPQVNFAQSSQAIQEFMGTTTATVTLSGLASVDVSVPFTLSGTASVGAGNDVVVSASPVIIPAGSLSKTIAINLNDDVLSEVSETLAITLGTPTIATKGSLDIYTLTITDNDFPKITNVTSALANGTYTTGNIDIAVQFSTNVDVTGTPLLKLNTVPARYASYISGSGSSSLLFRYAIQYDDSSPKLDYASVSAIELSGGFIKDSVNTSNADLTLKLPGAIGSLAANKNLVIAALTIPKIKSITVPTPGLYKEGDVLVFKIKFSEAVIVTDFPWLFTRLGGWDDWADYSSGSGTDTLTFERTLYNGDYGATLELLSPIELYTDPIKSLNGVDADLTFTPPPIPDVLVDATIHKLNFDSPAVSHSEVGSTGKQITVSIDQPAFEDVSLPVLVSGNATPDVDFKVYETSLTFAAGQTTATIHYDIFDDSINEANESFNIYVERSSSTKNFGLGLNSGIKVEIYDDDGLKDKWKVFRSSKNHYCGITNSGVLKCWGLNSSGQLGNSTVVDKDFPVTIDSGTPYQKVVLGASHTCGITDTNVLKCWGDNSFGQLGAGSTSSKSSPTIIDPGISYIGISTYNNHTCGVTSGNVLKCWGANSTNTLGDGTTTQRLSPVVIDSGVSYLSVAAGYNHSCGVTTSNVLKCWGTNDRLQAGINGMSVVPTPTVVDSGESYKLVKATEYYSCGVLTSGPLKCWGAGNNGRTGIGSNVDALPTVIEPGTNYLTVDLGDQYTCGVTEANILRCWGMSTGGLGTSYYTYGGPASVQPTTLFNDVSVGISFYCATTTSGYLKCWGQNLSGSQGFPSLAVEKTPQVINATANYKAIDSAAGTTCIISSADALFCWGYNDIPDNSGQLRYMPVLIDPGVSYKSVSVGEWGGCGITTLGKLKCWDSFTAYYLSQWALQPREIDAGTTYKSISSNYYHFCGITDTGTLKCWGDNGSYQLGTGDDTRYYWPTVIASGTSFKDVSVGQFHTCAITTSNKLKCWGSDFSNEYQVGDGTNTPRMSPVDIDSATDYAMVSTGPYSSCAITTTGLLKCWGGGSNGAIGDGASMTRPTPVAVDTLSSYKFVQVEYYRACGITTSNVLKCWGSNFYGIVGNGNQTNQWSPQIIDSGVGYTDVTLGDRMTCGLTNTGIFKCWGSNQLGGFGNKFGFLTPITIGPY